jgi:hypothetical protein
MDPFKYKDASNMKNDHLYPHPHTVEDELGKKILLIAALNSELKKQRELSEDLMELVDMFATNNVDLSFYKRIRKEYFDSKIKD